MARATVGLRILCLALALPAALAGGASASTSFGNTTPIVVAGAGSPNGSDIFVSGLGTSLIHVSVGVSQLTHSRVANLGLVLVGPSGAALVLEGGCGGSSSVSNISLVFSDSAGTTLPQSFFSSGTFKSTQYGSLGSFPPPGPGLAYQSPAPSGTSTLLSVFSGSNPNGHWSLYAYDPVSGDTGQISHGWSLQIDATPAQLPALPRGGAWILVALLGVTVSCASSRRPPGTTRRGASARRR
jgi:hypothetical protein